MIVRIFKTRYYIRHKILQVLTNYQLANLTPDSMPEDIELSVGKIATLSGLTEKAVWSQIDFLLESEEIFRGGNESIFSYGVSLAGIASAADDKYYRAGKKEFWEEKYDAIKTISAVVLLLIAIFTFAINIIETKRNSRDLRQLEKKVKLLNDSSLIRGNHPRP